MRDGHRGEYHALVTAGDVLQKLAAFLALLFQVIGDDSREVVALILPPLVEQVSGITAAFPSKNRT
jgi:hypothetical protein